MTIFSLFHTLFTGSRSVVFLVVLAISMSGCATLFPPKQLDTAAAEQAKQDIDDILDEDFDDIPGHVNDPIEGFNRAIFDVNDTVYRRVLSPVAQGYSDILNQDIRQSIANAFENAQYPKEFVNSILQGKFEKGLLETEQFLLNSTVGLLGFHKASDDYPHLDLAPEDTAQTLATWDIGNGFYIVLPFMGPTTLRDAAGSVGDHFLNPITYVDETGVSVGLSVEKNVNDLSLRLGEYESLHDAALDPYTAIKDAYIQYKNKSAQE